MKHLAVSMLVLVSCLLSTLVIPRPASAAVAANCGKSTFLGFPHWFEYLDIGPKNGDPCAIIGPSAGGEVDATKVGGLIGLAVVDILLRIGGMVAVGFVIYGGFKYILSQGEPDNTRKARGTILAAMIGMVIVILSSAAVNFIGRVLIK